jgi:hypothetical protein
MSKRTTKSAKPQADSSAMFEVISGARLQEMLKEQAKNGALALGLKLLEADRLRRCAAHGMVETALAIDMAKSARI